ncbi:MAG: hypothetical protein FJZ47_06035 [Candidatus Tectomicrobia bacterium]|uniref:Uncharacterized protein n=1 Tax=Tectimicrobiota bacterium TaxID=2528274 RepID=A0A937W110_UNCTE|nr:hypothetical protein [Candidatus Tectomicrobia bacterium]
MERDEYDALLHTLVQIARQQQGILERVESFMAQQVVINADIRTTLARLETLLARVFQHGENGREV